INGIRDRHGTVRPQGPNPFDYLGLHISADCNTGTPYIWRGNAWEAYGDLAAFEISQQPMDKRGKFFQLSHWLPTYDWVTDKGFDNFATWIA
ncbi:hypothetical protein JTL71_34875, partial [Pseudomonas aeruginosa]|nr:hypothetical protein [Pseudomonas aeruginosa]